MPDRMKAEELILPYMSTNELQELFHSELNADLSRFKACIDSISYKEIWAFAHKYKVRLHYMGYSSCYETCLKIERHFKAGEHVALLDEAAVLAGLLHQIRSGTKRSRHADPDHRGR